MPIIPPGGETPLTYTAFDIITDALIEAGILSLGEQANLDPDTGQWAFRKLNYLIDIWSAKAGYVYAQNFELFTLVAGLSPHTIGPDPSATFSVLRRPVKINSASLVLNSGTPVDLPIGIRDRKWWSYQQTKSIQSDIPTDLYYDPTNVNGSIYFWPVPNVQNQVRLELWIPLMDYIQINDPLAGPGEGGTLPQGYRAALMYTLAESLLPAGDIAAHPVLVKAGQEARAAVFGNNSQSPTMTTRDFGMPKSGRPRPDWNWRTGGRVGGPPE